jgi:hypothetical protein
MCNNDMYKTLHNIELHVNNYNILILYNLI